KDVLKRVAAKQTLDISEVSLDDVAGRELASRHGVLFAPGLLLDDEFFSYGRLSERKLRRELQRRHAG
ncbi:MAG: thioredoxin family protein, partial [Geodermatophilaceae bacterium]